jgi:hypothetical protein
VGTIAAPLGAGEAETQCRGADGGGDVLEEDAVDVDLGDVAGDGRGAQRVGQRDARGLLRRVYIIITVALLEFSAVIRPCIMLRAEPLHRIDQLCKLVKPLLRAKGWHEWYPIGPVKAHAPMSAARGR